MALSVKLTLENSATKKALANTKVALFFYQQSRGRVRPVQVGVGQSNARGQVSFSANVEVGNYLPRVLLKAVINNKWQNLTALPKTYTATAIDFGNVSVNTIQAINIGAVPYYGMANISLPAADAAVDAEKLKKIESANKTLSVQLKKEQTEKNRHLADLNTQKKQIEKIQAEKLSKDKEVQTLAQRLSAAEALKEKQIQELSVMRAEISRLKNRPAATPNSGEAASSDKALLTTSLKAETVYSQAVQAINKADEQGQQSGRFRISDAKMTLKVLSGEKEDEVRLIKNAGDFKTLSPQLMSVIELNLADAGPVKANTQQAESIQLSKMPELIGYTQSMALRKLAERGLYANTYQQQLSEEQVSKQASLIGQVIKQHPAAGKAINNPDDLALIIGAYSGEL